MAVRTFCDDIIKAYTHCDEVMSIYTYGELVWPLGPTPPGVWYMSWQPSDISGSFTFWGSLYRMEDYQGYFSWEGVGSGILSGVCYDQLSGPEGHKSYMETNVLSIKRAYFQNNWHLEEISCSRCKYIGDYAFNHCNSLQYVSLPKCLFIDSAAFSYCSVLSYASLPRVSYISYGGFNGCSSLESLYAPRLESVNMNAFAGTALNVLDLPSCKYIATNAFYGNHNMSKFSLPVCEYIGSGAFGVCTSLTSIYLPACTSTNGGFHGCTALISASLPVCSHLGVGTFSGCTSLSDVSLPQCSVLWSYAFNECISLSNISLPSVQYIGHECFMSCYLLESISLPQCKILGVKNGNSDSPAQMVFYDCSALSFADLGSCSFIGRSAFQNCISLMTLILRYSSVCRLVAGSSTTFDDHIFENTPFARCEGSILVPSSLVNSYKYAGGWKSMSCIIFPIP